MRLIGPLVLSLAVAGCANNRLEDPRFATGSRTIVASSDYQAVFAVNTDEGTVSRVSVDGSTVTSTEVGLEPTRIARAGDRVWVTLRGERAVAVLQDTGDGLELIEKVEVGPEPYGVVVSEDGSRVYVSVSMAGQVLELDGETMEVLRAWPIEREPRWLVLHPSGRSLYVASAFDGVLTRVDLASGDTEIIPLPTRGRVSETLDETVTLGARLTGDGSISPDGRWLALPGLYFDDTTPVGAPDDGSFDQGYASVGNGPSKFNPGVVQLPLDDSGDVDDPGDGGVVFGAATADLGDLDIQVVRSYPTTATYSPNGMMILMAMETSNVVVAISATETNADFTFDTGMRSDDAFVLRPQIAITTDAGPRGVTFVREDRALVHNFLDRTVADLDYAAAQDDVKQRITEGFSQRISLSADPGVTIAESALPEDVEAGRRLFYSSTNPTMAGAGSGISCSTCHFDGRNDGVTWTFDDGVRQTPSLAGEVSLTAPITWLSGVPTVPDEVLITSQGRMGGDGLSEDDATLVAAFVEWTRRVDVGDPADPEAVERGRLVFERADVGCAGCHPAPLYTDNSSHTMMGLVGVNTPSLLGVAATAPYFHDGAAKDLAEMVELAGPLGMGATQHLTDAEKSDLVAFLKSL